MAMTTHILPATYSAGYSAIPVRVSSTTVNTSDDLNYLINICHNEVEVTDIQTTAIANNTYASVTTATEHKFKIGDTILINDSNNSDAYTGYYNIIEVTNSTTFVIDLTLGPAFGGNSAYAYNVLKYKVPKDLQDEAKLDIANTIKDYVTQNLEDNNEIFSGSNSVFNYKLIIGEEYDYEFTFDDNLFLHSDPGKISFANFGLTSAAGIPFQIGDEIIVQQDLFEWSYDDNYFGPGLGFTGSSTHPFRVGQQITVTGQVTEPYYNGVTTIASVNNYPSSVRLITDKSFTTSTPVEPGVITGVPVPEYNTICRVVDIIESATYGVVIATDIDAQQSTPAIGGKIKFVNLLTQDTNTYVSDNLYAYNAGLKKVGYDKDGFDPYVIQDRATVSNNISTILGQYNNYRIEQSTKSWLLAHTDGSNTWEPRFTFYDSNNTLLSQIKVGFNISYGSQVDIYSYANNGGNLRLNLNSAHGLSVGDTLEIFSAPAAYLGITTVLSVQSTTALTVDVTYTGTGVLGAEYIKQVQDGYYNDFYFPVGVDQLIANTNTTLLSGATLSTVTDSIDYYTVALEKDSSVNTNEITYFINEDCSKYELYHLMWKDRLGSWLSYPFKYISIDKTEVEKKNYYQTEENWDNGSFGYDTYGRGEKTYFSRGRDMITLNTGWVTEYENDLMKDMLLSASIYVQLPDGTLLGAQIENKDITFGEYLKDQIWNYKIDIRVSRNQIRL